MHDTVGSTEQLAAMREVLLRILDSHRYTTRLILERILAALGLLIVALPMLPVAVLVKLDSLGPVLYRQVRVGRCEQLFAAAGTCLRLCRFRFTVVGAEKVQHSPARSAGQDERPIFGPRRHLG